MVTVCLCCMDKPAKLAILPCTHSILCGGCFNHFLEEKRLYNKCPLCRASIEEYCCPAENFHLLVSSLNHEEEDDEDYDPEDIPTDEEDLDEEEEAYLDEINAVIQDVEDYVPEEEDEETEGSQ